MNPVGRRGAMPGRSGMGRGVGSEELPSLQILSGFFSLFNAPIASVVMTAWKGPRDLGRREREIRRRESAVVMNPGPGIRLTGRRPGTAAFQRASLASSVQWGS